MDENLDHASRFGAATVGGWPSRPPTAESSTRGRRARLHRGRARSRTRLALATWRDGHQASSYGFLDLDVTESEAWCRTHGIGLTPLVVAALGQGLAAVPDLNARLVLGRVRPRRAVDVSVAVATERGAHLTAVCLRESSDAHPAELSTRLAAAVRRALRGDDDQFGRAIALADRLPGPLVGPGLALVGFVSAGLGINLPVLRVRAQPLGGALLTSLGTLDLDRALPPLVPFARLPVVAALGATTERAWAVDGDVLVRRIATLGLTIDHRLADGAQMAAFARVVRTTIEHPWERWPVDRSRSRPSGER